MNVLAKNQLNVSNKTLQRAILMPKDKEENSEYYPKVRDSLFHNPYGTVEYKKEEAARKKIEAA